MLRFAILAILALALLVPSPAGADSFWNHNGSVMRLRADGSTRTFLYEQPRPGIAAEGVRRGTVLFQGTITGDSGHYSGTALIFSARCGNRPYQVDGQLGNDGYVIRLNGRAPRVNQSTCQPNGFKDDKLVFEFIRSDKPPVAYPPFKEGTICNTDLDKYQACVVREANSICRGRTEYEDLFRCFTDASKYVYKKSGLTGYATDLIVGAGAPFVRCSNGACQFWGGGSMYTCVRLDANRVRECDESDGGERCTTVDCPIRRCKILCAKAE
jgi:hypothetical protein